MLRRPAARGGFTLVDLLLTLAILGIVVVISTPPLLRSTSRLRLRMAAAEASRTFALARSYAVRHSANVGVKFHPGTGGAATTWSLHLDGDGDGVLSADVRAGALRLRHRLRLPAGAAAARPGRAPPRPPRRPDPLQPLRHRRLRTARHRHPGLALPHRRRAAGGGAGDQPHRPHPRPALRRGEGRVALRAPPTGTRAAPGGRGRTAPPGV